jgi:uncharacterized protein (TIGR02271 family)
MTANLHDQQAQANIPSQQASKTLAGQASKTLAGQASKATPSEQGSKTPARNDETWIDRREERLQVGKESFEAGHVKLHRYVDAEPAEKTVHLSHEEYDVERVPLSADQPIRDTVGEFEQEITLHGERGIMRKETVPVERVRLVTKNVEEDQTFRDEIRRERIEIEPEQEALPDNGRRQGKQRGS